MSNPVGMEVAATREVTLTAQQMKTIIAILEITLDWNAPAYYDIPEPRGWNDLEDPSSSEPSWVSLYRLLPMLRATIAPPKAAKP